MARNQEAPEKPLNTGKADKNETGGSPDSAKWQKLRTSVDARMQALETYRYSWWVHWRELADYILPRRYRWLITANAWQRGSPINQRIIDNTSTIAARTLASGMMSGITSPSRPWFQLSTTDTVLDQQEDVRVWLDDCVSRMQQVLSSSNYYVAKAQQYFDLVVFGTAPMIIYEDIGGPQSKIIACFNPCAGEYFCATNKDFKVTTLYRKFTMTISQVVDMFGLDACSETIKTAWKQQGSAVDREIIIGHCIEPNPDFIEAGGPSGTSSRGVPSHFQFQEVYWEYGSSQTNVLRVQGFMDQPFSCPRWDTTGNDAYGRSPAMDALGDTKQLQVEQKRKAQAIDKMVNPPMQADASMKNEPASLLPGAVTYVPSLNNASQGFRPIFQVTPPIVELKEDIKEAQQRIKDTFFNDLFLMISQLDTVRTATEIDARREEKLVLLGPVLERFNNEGLDPDIARVFRIMARNGLFAPPPAALRGAALKAQYVSVLADQQRASSTTAIERFFAFIGSLSGVVTDAIDKGDTDEAIEIYGEALRVPAKIIRSGAALQQVRQARAQQNAQQQAAQATTAGVQGAQTLSQTPVGGGRSALELMLQGGGLPQGNA